MEDRACFLLVTIVDAMRRYGTKIVPTLRFNFLTPYVMLFLGLLRRWQNNLRTRMWCVRRDRYEGYVDIRRRKGVIITQKVGGLVALSTTTHCLSCNFINTMIPKEGWLRKNDSENRKTGVRWMRVCRLRYAMYV